MAVLLSNFVWEGLSTEAKPSYEAGARDGHIYKEYDTGESYIRVLGVWEFINLGLAFIKATKSGKATTDGSGQYHVEFDTAFINDEYTVALSTKDTGGTNPPIACWYNVTKDGFDIQTRSAPSGSTVGGVVVSWLATRDYNI